MLSCEKLVVVSDVGVDDASALMLAFTNGILVQILAVMCCYGNTNLNNTCQNVMRVLTLCNEKEIPIYKGSAGALISGKRDLNESIMGEDGLGNRAYEFPTGDLTLNPTAAAEELIQLTLQYPGEIILVALAPLTDVALAQRIDHQFTRRLKSLVILGGTYKGKGNINEVAEFNFYCDPEAADIVLREAECPVTLVPWETCANYGFNWDMYKQITKIPTPRGIFYKRVSKYFAENVLKTGLKDTVDADLLAMVAVLYPESVTSSIESALAVECGGTYTRGMTILLNENSPEAQKRRKIKIVTGFDQNLLNKLRFKLLMQIDF